MLYPDGPDRKRVSRAHGRVREGEGGSPREARLGLTATTLSPAVTRTVGRVGASVSFADAPRRVVIGDGAAWMWRIADEGRPDTTQIIDLEHATHHLAEVAATLVGTGTDATIALRCCLPGGRFEDCWERRAQERVTS